MQSDKDFLTGKINDVIGQGHECFVTNFCLKTPTRKGYRPSFSHFEVVYSGLLSITLPASSGFKQTQLRPNDVLYLVPDAWVGREMNTQRELLVINLHDEAIECYFSSHMPDYPDGYFHRRSYFTSSPLDLGGLHILKSFEYYSREKNCHMQQELFKLFLELIKSSITSDKGKNNTKNSSTYKMVLQFIRDNCCTDINRKSVAYEFGLSPDYITHLFQKYSSSPFNRVLQQYKMERAAEFLGESKINIDQTAALCGFGETSYFIKIFRRFYGVTPSEYRRNLAT